MYSHATPFQFGLEVSCTEFHHSLSFPFCWADESRKDINLCEKVFNPQSCKGNAFANANMVYSSATRPPILIFSF